MEHRRSGARGSVIIQVAITLAVLFGFAALTVDYGLLVVTQRKLQNATDAAALAAGPDLVIAGNPEARVTAERYANLNQADTASALVTGYEVEVAALQEVETPFIRVLDPSRRSSTVRARSVVQAFPVQQAWRLRPWGIPIGFFNPGGTSSYRLGDPADLVLVESKNEQPPDMGSNITFVEPLALGSKDPASGEYPTYMQNVRMGFDQPVSVEIRGRNSGLDTQPTASLAELIHATQRAVYLDDNSLLRRAEESRYQDDTWEEYQPDNPRIVFLPVIDRARGGGGTGDPKGRVYGFAAFYIDRMENNVIKGRFIPYTLPWDGKDPGKILPEAYKYGLYSFRLTQ